MEFGQTTTRWLILDVSNLAHRAFHTTGGLSYDGRATGVLYGVFRDILNLQDRFGTNNVAFCFDGGYDYRLSIFPDYKISRRTKSTDMPGDELETRRDLRRQIYRLRSKYLTMAGFRNVFWQDGYEADDLIASICMNLSDEQSAIVVSSDEDLFQLLSESVSIWSPAAKKPRTLEWFIQEYEIEPSRWSEVKAMAGCKTDDIPGIPGVGDKTAARYIGGKLKPHTKAYRAIETHSEATTSNLRLTKLPAPGTEELHLVEDHVNIGSWNKVMQGLGMKSLMGRML